MKQSAVIRTNAIKDSVCSVHVHAVKFSTLWASYPNTAHPYVDLANGKVPSGFENQCAIRVSLAIHGAGIELKSFQGASVNVKGKKAAIRAEQLAVWLKKQPFCGLPQKPENITGKGWENKIKGRTGIVFFANYWRRDGEATHATGDHIDLWNGSGLTPSATKRLRRLGVSSIQWLPSFLGRLNFSDLVNSTEILFWEIQ